MKVVVAMSGGVDSSVAAARLQQEGHDVIGVTMQLGPGQKQGDGGAVADAKKVSDKLGIRHHVVNFRDIFARRVIADFGEAYRQGRTPNPCIRCNRYIKFGALLERARELGAQFLATGHYARIERDQASGACLLKKGADRHKDQSYFLCQLTQAQLQATLFPLGSLTKDRVRQIAGELGLSVAARPESEEICFIPDNDYPGFLKDYLPQATSPGPILDELGHTLGIHQGIASYTIGQRQGLGLAAREPLYVTAIEPERNAIVVGNREKTYSRDLVASNLNWIAISRPEHALKIKARIRYRHPEAEAVVTPLGEDRVYVRFTEPQMAITPGQAVVFYEGDTVIGGGTIDRNYGDINTGNGTREQKGS